MAIVYDVNNLNSVVTGGAEVFTGLKQVLVTAGWTVRCSGGGTGSGLFSASGDVIGADPTKLNVSNAWYVVRAPSGMTPRREFLIQRGSTQTSWRVWVSSDGTGFTGTGFGTVDEDTPPSAADAHPTNGNGQVWGTTGGFGSLFGSAGTYNWHVVAEAASPYTFWMACIESGTGLTRGVMVFDVMASGSYPAEDIDPGVYFVSSSISAFSALTLYTSTSSFFQWYKKGFGSGAGELWVRVPAAYLAAPGTFIPGGTGTNPYNTRDNHFPMPVGRPAALTTSVGWKGYTSMLRWLGTSRSTTDTLSTGGVRDRIIMGDITAPFPNIVPVF